MRKMIRNSVFIRFFYSVFFYWPLYFFSGFFKRNKKIWLITCHHGFVDNSKYFYILYHDYLKSNYDIDLIWLAHKREDKNKLNKLGFKNVVLKNTIKGIFFSFVSKVYISSYGIDGFFQPFSRNAFLVNLWHGVGIKNMKFKGEVEPLIDKVLSTPLSKIIYPTVYTKYDFFLSTSELMTDHFSECFGMNENSFFVSEYPRCKLLTMPKEELKFFIEKYEAEETIKLINDISSHDKAFIYMPTWRDNNPDFLTAAGIDWQVVNKVLVSKKYALILKLHPSCKTIGLKDYSNIFVLNPKIDIYPILSFTDCLITDYSSIYFDYLLTDKNIALFVFDYQEYMENCRDFAYPYDENMVGFRIKKISEFKCFFDSYESINFNEYRPILNEIKNKFWTPEANFADFVEKIKREVI